MSQEQRTALVQAHRRARRQLAALQASRVSCRTVATELLSDDPSFRGCQPPLAPATFCVGTIYYPCSTWGQKYECCPCCQPQDMESLYVLLFPLSSCLQHSALCMHCERVHEKLHLTPSSFAVPVSKIGRVKHVSQAQRVHAAIIVTVASLGWQHFTLMRGLHTRRPEAYGEVLTALEQPQEKLLQELEIHGHLRYTLCCILSAFQVPHPCV